MATNPPHRHAPRYAAQVTARGIPNSWAHSDFDLNSTAYPPPTHHQQKKQVNGAGQTNQLGRYALHFHMMGEHSWDTAYVTDSAIRK